MALIKRYGLYTAIAAFFLYMLYSLSFPYDTSPPPKDGKKGEPKKPDKPKQKPPLKSYDWAKVAMNYPVATSEMAQLPTSEPTPLPRIQHKFEDEDVISKNIRETRQEEVKKQFMKCWRNYRKKAWMHDELKPISGGSEDPFGGWAATMIDALDTLYIMGFKEEFTSAIKDVEKINFGYTPLEKVNMFETNIRHLGGLLAAYELSGDERLLKKAKEVGEMLYHAFDTPNHMPITRWDFHNAGEGEKQSADETVLLAELGSFTMEFTRLSQLTGDPKWYDAANRVTALLNKQQMGTKLPGMWPIVVNARKPDLTKDSGFTLASMADSTYEYFSKTFALLGGLEPVYKKLYEKAMETAIKHTLYRPMTPENTDMLGTGFVRAEGSTAHLNPELQHLSCYAGGMFALGGKLFEQPEHVTVGRKLTDTCVWAYKASPAGIMPEVSHLYKCPNMTECTWSEQVWKEEVAKRADLDNTQDPLKNIANLRLPKGFTSIDDRRYILRPEAIESVFIMYRITGEQSWQAAAWDMWTAIQSATDTDIGNSALLDVSAEKPPRQDSMESFWMAETLKYFYLIFSPPNTISLDDFVFNTEAHPFKIPKPKPQ
ncbi:glycoside hydrolase family 47 protein [Trematosphaeria pertusa]|uniref:alpha-1,2-Mannosidase n=1 Tax=Trematosphaeria pertusa TaxID=390896 RepID=A0A6A6IQ44_9PLEO|nr:glycoside hydrolase family 47 protein [Trematosphaeria pertusa]KAF2252536.1 glycoside hydrolase family 47 protein [Trematosphaeria pertusa]